MFAVVVGRSGSQFFNFAYTSANCQHNNVKVLPIICKNKQTLLIFLLRKFGASPPVFVQWVSLGNDKWPHDAMNPVVCMHADFRLQRVTFGFDDNFL